ncbi:cytochrome P450, partial [Rozella allomycis CSF55]
MLGKLRHEAINNMVEADFIHLVTKMMKAEKLAGYAAKIIVPEAQRFIKSAESNFDSGTLEDTLDTFYNLISRIAIKVFGGYTCKDHDEWVEQLIKWMRETDLENMVRESPLHLVAPWYPPLKQKRAEKYLALRKLIVEIADEYCLDAETERVDYDIVFGMVHSVIFAAVSNQYVVISLYLINLSQYPEWKVRIENELEPLINYLKDNDLANVEQLPLNIIDNTPLLEAGVLETIRMNSFGFAPRFVEEDTEVPLIEHENIIIPKNSIVFTSHGLVHLDGNINKNPDIFNPERFIENGKCIGSITASHRGTFLGFGAGRHPCTGMKFAMLQIKLVTSLILSHWDIKFDAEGANETQMVEEINIKYFLQFFDFLINGLTFGLLDLETGSTYDPINDELTKENLNQIEFIDISRLFLMFFKIGFNSYGGPVGQIGLLYNEFVKERKWMDKNQFNRVFNFLQLLPGCESIGLCGHLGYLRRGKKGAIIAAFAYILPGLLLMATFSYISLNHQNFLMDSKFVQNAFDSIMAVVAALALKSSLEIFFDNIEIIRTSKFISIQSMVKAIFETNPAYIIISGGIYQYLFSKTKSFWLKFCLLLFFIFDMWFFFLSLVVELPILSPTPTGFIYQSEYAYLNLYISGFLSALICIGGFSSILNAYQNEVVSVNQWMAVSKPKLPKGNSFLSEKTGDLELEVDFLQSRLGSIKDLLEKERQLSKNWTTKGPIYSHAKQILQSHKIALKSLQRSQSSQSQASFKSNLGRGAGDEFEKPIENEIKSKVKEINSYRPKSTKDMVGTNDEVYDEAESHRSFQEALNNWRESRK